jgi:hypothetical protein
MTQRELWRQLNHQFHGIKPSAKRSERELESYKRELSAKKKANADTPLGSMQMLKAATKVSPAHGRVVDGMYISVFVLFLRMSHERLNVVLLALCPGVRDCAPQVAGQHFVERKPLKPHELAKPQ